MVNIRRRIEAYARVAVFMVVPVEKGHGKGSGILNTSKSAWELRTVFHGFVKWIFWLSENGLSFET